MPLQIEFETAGSDWGTLHVRGLPQVGSEVLVAVQRLADDRYLTPHGRWDEAASWYPCPRLDGDDDATVRFSIGAALTQGLRAARGTALRVHVRRRDFADCGPLEGPAGAPQALTPDGAATDAPLAGPTPAATPTTPNPAPAGARRTADRDARDAPAPGLPRPGAASPPTRAVQRAPLEATASVDPVPLVATTHGGTGAVGRAPTPVRTLRHWTAATLSILCGGALCWWYLAARTRDPVPQPTRPTLGTTAGAPAGKALFLELQSQDLTPTDLFGHAERVALAGDCDASGRLFIEAAKRDPALAQRLGRRYDPADFRPSPCFPAPNPDSAQVWYQRAAAAGIREAQRRYAELLLGEAEAGPVYQDAITWLRKAAAAGDAAAAERLATLQQR